MERTRPQTTNFYSQEEAEGIWSEAAKLQSQAQNRLEERSKAISARQETEDPSVAIDGFDADELRGIAEEAGISSEFVDLALLKAKSGPLVKKSEDSQTLTQRLVDLDELDFEKSMTFDMPLAQVYSAMKRVFPSQKYDLELSDVIGDGTPGDTVLGFKVPSPYSSAGTVNSFAYQLSYSDVKTVYATIHPISDDKCQVTLRGEASGKASKSYVALSLFFAFCLAFFVWPIGIKGFELEPLTQIVPLFLLVFGIASKTLFSASNSAHKWGGKKTQKALNELLQAIKVDALTNGSFSSTSEKKTKPNFFGTDQLL